MKSVDNKHLVDGHLVACPKKPNCVCSEACSGDSYVEPLKICGSMTQQWNVLKDVIVDMGGKIEEADDYFLHATFQSRVFRFIDDVICRQDAEKKLIQIRSSSRFGYSDFGVNRKRVDKLRENLQSRIDSSENQLQNGVGKKDILHR